MKTYRVIMVKELEKGSGISLTAVPSSGKGLIKFITWGIDRYVIEALINRLSLDPRIDWSQFISELLNERVLYDVTIFDTGEVLYETQDIDEVQRIPAQWER
jgi:hypothetical protein